MTTCHCGTAARTDNDSGVCDQWPTCQKPAQATAVKPKVTRTETNTARFGRVITYRVKVGNVTVSAERMVGLDDDYSVSTHVGQCGMSFCQPVIDGERVKVTGGNGVAARVLAAAETIVAAGAYVNRHPLCTDRAACGQAATS